MKKQAEVYTAPMCTVIRISSEGILCGSFGSEGFKGMGENGTAPTYGDGLENNGWN